MTQGKQQKPIDIIKQGSRTWNEWRRTCPQAKPNLRRANLIKRSLRGADLRGTDLSDAKLQRATLRKVLADDQTTFHGAALRSADLRGAKLPGANLEDCDLRQVILVDTDLSGAKLSRSKVYGASVWDVNLDGAEQNDLIITPPGVPTITLDNLEVAQFIYLLLDNRSLRDVIDTITSKVVLILGRFTPERKAVLEAIKQALRASNYLPVIFDFTPPDSRDLIESVSTLAHLSRFVIVDFTDPNFVDVEIGRIVHFLPSVPVQPILMASAPESTMFPHFRLFPWFLQLVAYSDQDHLLSQIDSVVLPAVERFIARR